MARLSAICAAVLLVSGLLVGVAVAAEPEPEPDLEIAAPIWTYFLPVVSRAGFEGWDTGVNIQNVNQWRVSGMLQYYDDGGNWAGVEKFTIAPFGAYRSWQCAELVPEGWQGSAILTVGSEVAVVVNGIGPNNQPLTYTPPVSRAAADTPPEWRN